MREFSRGRSRPPEVLPLRAARKIAFAAIVAGVALPLVRRRLGISPAAAIAGAALAPAALCVAVRRSPPRDIATCTLQMWAYVAAYKMPHGSDPEALERARQDRLSDRLRPGDRLRAAADRPTPAGARRPRRLPGPRQGAVATHWVWFSVPHVALTYILFRHPERFPAGGGLTYAVFDLGAVCYWVVPTAPPWYAAEQGRFDGPRRRPRCGRHPAAHGRVRREVLARRAGVRSTVSSEGTRLPRCHLCTSRPP